MKKRSSVVSESLPPLKLYLDDLETVCATLREVCADVTFKTKDYETNDPAELVQLPTDRVRSLEIWGTRPTIAVMLGRTLQLLSADNDITSQGLLRKVRNELEPHTRGLVLWLQYPRGFIFTGVILAVLAYTILDNSHWDLLKKAILIAIDSFALVGVSLTAWYGIRGGTRVILSKRKDSPGFWRRNRDALVVGAVLAVFGAAVGSVLTYLFTRP